MAIRVKAPGTCGELAQGTIDGKNFLITCPIDLYSEVAVSPGSQAAGDAGEKTRAAASLTLKYLQQPETGLTINVNSALPVGKGMASSSADIAAVCQATAKCFGRLLTADEIADIALAIEPTDGVFYPGIIMFDHVHGSIRQPLGNPPAIRIAVFDAGGEVNTQSFNQRKDLAALNAAKEGQLRQAVALVREGLRCGDCRMIGQGATLSAVANQAILHKPDLDAVIKIAYQHGAVGVNAAHSGTVIGILFSAGQLQQLPQCIAAVAEACPNMTYLQTVQMISGGLIVVEE